jgi:alcohol dehydrogenase (cytochrome c)
VTLPVHAARCARLGFHKEISPEGRPILLPGNMPNEEGTRTCPDLGGGTNYCSPLYDPSQRLFFVNARETGAIYYTWNEPC